MTNPTPTDDVLVRTLRVAGMLGERAADRIEAQAAEIERLRAEVASACSQLRESALAEIADLGQYTDWQIQAAEREAAAFRAGAEAMRERAAVAADDCGMTYEVTIGRDRGVRTVEYKDGASAIRALPLPDHQSSTETK